jgi:mono/diheme cytochrome c family protein
MRLLLWPALVLGLFLAACSREEEPAAPSRPAGAEAAGAAAGGEATVSLDAMLRGARLYQEHCAQCHGPEAQGHPDWQNPQVVAAPPLDGTGPVWKRSKRELIAIIRNGAKRGNQPVMPGWQGRLSDQEIEDIIAWFQALWPAEVYERWRKANADAVSPKG